MGKKNKIFNSQSPRSFLRFQSVAAAMDDDSTSSFPVPHKKFSILVKESKIDIVICSHDDQLLVIATQIGTMGTIMHARKEEGMLNSPTFNVSVIFGKRDEPMLQSCARQLIEQISNSGSSKSLTLSIGLKDHSMETLKAIVSGVIENRLW
ncbi:uncharacterized protein LOC112511170 [Cynara cardunculus var. scolymus]|uniref:Proteasome assembly chaperone 3 n=1 Tax=Cynara cardunculus var. scolymus TaxID=59895 RepID=A0A124SHC7_CYNCS|nr:uncharacterized protein LOC112511170 [Cynara cardunculus var. scolymus]KVI09163.1 Proteasome assembly chaperone 3 [Cynara cardunculus var. scolymus]